MLVREGRCIGQQWKEGGDGVDEKAWKDTLVVTHLHIVCTPWFQP